MIENRRVWLDRLLSASIEGGYVNDPDDGGGPTNLGITARTLGVWRKLGRDATEDEVRAVTRDEAEGIALALYWNAVRGDQLPGGIDIYAADFAFNSGPGTAARILQELVGTAADGFVGDKTIAAVRAVPPQRLLEDYDDARMTYLRGLKNWPKFGNGWTDRCQQMRKLARSRIKARPLVTEVATSKTSWLGGLVALLGLWPEIQPFVDDMVGVGTDLSADRSPEAMAKSIVLVVTGLSIIARRAYDWQVARR